MRLPVLGAQLVGGQAGIPAASSMSPTVTCTAEEGGAALCIGGASLVLGPMLWEEGGRKVSAVQRKKGAEAGSGPRPAVQMAKGIRVACCLGHITSGGQEH